MLRCSFVSASVCKQDTLGSVFWFTMLKSLWSCAWLGSMDAGPSRTTLPCDLGGPLHSSTRQECNVAWPENFQVLRCNLFNFIFRLSEKCKKSVSLKSPRVRLRLHTWLIPMGATLTWAVKALEKGDDTAAKTGFSVPFPETNLETTHREILSDLNILVFLLHRSQ